MVGARLSLLAGIFFLAVTSPLVAQTSKPLRVALTGESPFVYSQNDVWQGLSVDIWDQVAAHNTWNYVYTWYPTSQAAIDAMTKGQADIIVSDMSIVSSLFSTVEFSQPYFRSGLQIMITGARPKTMGKFFEEILSWFQLKTFWGIVAAIILFSALVLLFERKHNPDFPKKWSDGIAEAFYYVVSLGLGKSGYKGFGGWFGRLVMIVWLILGVIVVAYVTSSLSAVMTVERLSSKIGGPQDLPGHTVGAVTGTFAVHYLEKHGITIHEYPSLPEAVQGLVKGEVPALVGPAPILQYYDNSHPQIDITEVGPVFSPYNYGFAMLPDSPLRAPLNSALLTLQESGVLFQIGRKYFGDVYQP